MFQHPLIGLSFWIFMFLMVWMWLVNGSDLFQVGAFSSSYLFALGIPWLMLHAGEKTSFRPERYFLMMSWSTVLVGIYGVSIVVFNGFDAGFLPEHSWTYKFREEFARHTGLHPPYYGLFASASIVFFLHSKALIHRRILYFLRWLPIIFLSGLLLALETRIHLLTLFPLLILFSPSARLPLLVLLFLVGIVMWWRPQSRFQELIERTPNSATLRWESWRCGWQVFRENPWTGAGAASVQSRLDACYAGKSPGLLHMNTHNQFLHFLASGGGVPFILWLFECGLIIYVFGIRKNFPALICTGVFLAFCCTENVMERQWGGCFMGFLTGLAWNSLKE
ncbi:MAG: O-antigen ligase family protein [Flavobacteriales bacterium]|nr:O-antigen ligase family protein [Flavobacteriales bacterium]MDW8431920.1 O-antigen ligase family protein [Flavobacteriales bacterium]